MRFPATRCPPTWQINTISTSTVTLRMTRAVSGHLLRRELLLDRASVTSIDRKSWIWGYRNSRSWSGVRPAERRMDRRVPRSRVRWSGTTTWQNGFSRRKTMWLPTWRTIWKPPRSRARTHSLPDITGRWLTRLRGGRRNVRQGPASCRLPGRPRTPGRLPSCWPARHPAFRLG